MTNRVSGLSDAHASEARRVILIGVRLLIAHKGAVHYTKDLQERWEGIRRGYRIADRDFPHHGDCSSTHSWLLWNALTHVGVHRDLVNDAEWLSGYTGTIAQHGKRVYRLTNAKVGDAVLYGPEPTFEHVATYIGGGRVFSHGSEGGPYLLGVDYRPDRGMMRRSI
jgi:cell wall-associated NlpC family hydrolase